MILNICRETLNIQNTCHRKIGQNQTIWSTLSDTAQQESVVIETSWNAVTCSNPSVAVIVRAGTAERIHNATVSKITS
jgi:hypothetical protein